MKQQKALDLSFFEQSTIEVAKRLIGMHLVHELDGVTLIGRITETEAYLGVLDRACHSYGRRRTKRTAILYEEAGRCYTYTMHTHCLLNVVCEQKGQPEAVLIRAMEPISGIEEMERLRGKPHTSREFANGPGKLTKAMGITMADYGRLLTEPPLYFAKGDNTDAAIVATKRIGIKGAGPCSHHPWRFIDANSRAVSAYRP
ncbi:3-methyladenine DNA glycosylase [Shouchella clausii]|jgi:DNA-3-methyladenine glycosylase|uniref:Putative 3-methyladenine DNA glycosylase n=1 Tax=Shouchella clausii TaxID=79880 RepID=A0A268RZ66_SHOCL|nr:DNA-3-methyladenine glycosylase [Shouchella clausii]PAD42991.1 3-methyladenine DNA glycosylase [Bacillus sp. 7520-S]MBU8597675.1 DNA-3-methyladenine glycosylase [Shouchella clausii]MCM3549012.1 DNA-3-methyladenine glycosylase [Shouchella clausii]MCY1106965.1 DNA-3-methyladenine glycosylase [Shouchella clausii]MED4158081.1 DNA-3-methyladenine glycosylase [Shouchella clausii]